MQGEASAVRPRINRRMRALQSIRSGPLAKKVLGETKCAIVFPSRSEYRLMATFKPYSFSRDCSLRSLPGFEPRAFCRDHQSHGAAAVVGAEDGRPIEIGATVLLLAGSRAHVDQRPVGGDAG